VADACEVQIANAVAAELNDPARPWAGQFTAQPRSWLPVYGPDELMQAGVPVLRVAVVPLTIAAAPQGRGSRWLYDYGVAIELQKKVLTPQAATATIDALAQLAESIQGFYADFHVLATLAGWRVVGSQREDVYDLAQLYEDNTFATLVGLRVRGWR